ncbi:MAG: hypothetical protein U0353_13710 [Sandaracinus sp.]
MPLAVRAVREGPSAFVGPNNALSSPTHCGCDELRIRGPAAAHALRGEAKQPRGDVHPHGGTIHQGAGLEIHRAAREHAVVRFGIATLGTVLLLSSAGCGSAFVRSGTSSAILTRSPRPAEAPRAEAEPTHTASTLALIDETPEARLDRIEAEIAESEARAARARDAARFEDCRAAQAERRSQAAQRVAACWQSAATNARCEAGRSERRASGTIWGCLLGIGAAALTGGAAAPLALGGCGAGYLVSGGREGECGDAPTCDLDELATGGALDGPLCGGRLGIEVADSRTHARGLRVDRTGGGTARSLRLEAGDVVIGIDGVAVSDLAQVAPLMVAAEARGYVDVTVVRASIPYRLRGSVGRTDPDGHTYPRPMLGATLEVVDVEYADGAEIASLAADHADGLVQGDVIARVGDQDVWSSASLRAAVAELPTAVPVRVVVRRGGGTLQQLDVVPLPRGEDAGL